MYQSLDAIDGKQARRTGSANPLGELFDHGCDSISTVFVALSACTAVQLGYYPGWMFFQVRYMRNYSMGYLNLVPIEAYLSMFKLFVADCKLYYIPTYCFYMYEFF